MQSEYVLPVAVLIFNKKKLLSEKVSTSPSKKKMNCDEIRLEYSEKKGEDEQSKSKLILVY